MQVGEVIRRYRKEKNMTQEQMAKRLGVTAPAVNKWENGNSLPDISLLSPIARLLDITLDTLLSHEKELSDIEANRLIEEANERLKTGKFDDAFQWMKQCITEYPNSLSLTLWLAQIFDSHLQMQEIYDRKKYDDYILECYKRVLNSDNEGLKRAAAQALYYFYMEKEQYEQAEEYLTYFSQESPERKLKQAMICSKTGRQEEAYKLYEEILYAGYQSLSMAFQDLYMLALKENDLDKAHMLVNKIQSLAHLFEFGEYHEISPGLELAIIEKNVPETLNIMNRMLNNLESLYGFAKSPLYAHMELKPVEESYFTYVREELIKGLQDDETYGYLKDNSEWRDLIEKWSV